LSQVQPLVVDGVMYFTTTTNDVIAADAATGDEVWRYRHKFSGQLPRDPRNRGVGYGKVYLAANDRRVVPLDQATGKMVWDTEIAGFDPRSKPGLGQPGKPLPGPVNFVLIAAPLVLDGMIIAGATGFEQNDIGDAALNAPGDVIGDWIQNNLGRRAFLFALNATTGEEIWRW
jgi:glucose dehydrogenase